MSAAAIGEANETAAPIGQPTSSTSSFSPSTSANAIAFGPTTWTSRPTASPIATNPTPTVSPARKLFANPWPSARPSSVMMTGIITGAPRSRT